MEFAPNSQRYAGNHIPIMDITQAGQGRPTYRGIARPVALKSNNTTETLRGLEGKDSSWERPPIIEYSSLSKKRCNWPAKLTFDSSSARLCHTIPAYEASNSRASYSGQVTPQNSDRPTGTLSKSLIRDYTPENRLVVKHRGECTQKDAAPVFDRDKLPQKAPSVDRVCAMNACLVSTQLKRSAFREVARHPVMGSCGQQCPASSLRQLVGETKESLRHNDAAVPFCLNSAVAAHTPFAPNPQPFYNSPQTLSAVHGGSNIQRHKDAMELKDAFKTPTYIPLKQHLPTDFLKYISDRNYMNPYTPESQAIHNTTNSIKQTHALQFGTFPNSATTSNNLDSVSLPWQQPLFPTSVLPLSSSISTPQYDNWCAKCNASFRMTSDLVYHMRTQHKRSADASGATADKTGGKRAAEEEKLKCDVCGETFRERHHLTRHMTSHGSAE